MTMKYTPQPCTQCGVTVRETKESQRYRWRKTGLIFCRPACGYAHRDANRHQVSADPTLMSCCICGGDVKRSKELMALYRKSGRAYCSKRCSGRYRSELSSRVMANTNRKYASKRMTERNPMSNPDTRKKVSETLREIGHKPMVRGGNGKPPTKAEVALISMLGMYGFQSQFVVTTGWGTSPGPGHYKIDCANPTLKIAIEADGMSHASLSRQASDARKDSFLRGEGWTVFRFSNETILKSPATVMSTISRLMTVTPTSPTA